MSSAVNVIPLEWEEDNELLIAAHAEVEKWVDSKLLEEESAWGFGPRFSEQGAWATYCTYTIIYPSNNEIVMIKTSKAIDILKMMLDGGTSVSQSIDAMVSWLEEQPKISQVIRRNNLIDIFFSSGPRFFQEYLPFLVSCVLYHIQD